VLNCRKGKFDDERGSIGILGNIGFLLLAKVPLWPDAVCKDCSRQVRLFGVVSFIIGGIAIAIFAIGY
jgi:hypothetical protein